MNCLALCYSALHVALPWIVSYIALPWIALRVPFEVVSFWPTPPRLPLPPHRLFHRRHNLFLRTVRQISGKHLCYSRLLSWHICLNLCFYCICICFTVSSKHFLAYLFYSCFFCICICLSRLLGRFLANICVSHSLLPISLKVTKPMTIILVSFKYCSGQGEFFGGRSFGAISL